jgi:hypothetical protein
MQAWERPLADLCLDGHSACWRTFRVTTDPGPVTFQDQWVPLSSDGRSAGGVRREI